MQPKQNDISAKVLVQFAHPVMHKSRVNAEMLEAVADLTGVKINDLYNEYPDMDIDVAREQKLMSECEVVVFQHPFYWYSTPPIIKEWLDLVLEHGWAYGRAGNALRGKKVLGAITTGGSEEAYQSDGYNRYTMAQLLRPLEQTFRLCGMEFLTPFVVHGTHLLKPDEISLHAADYARIIEALRDNRIDFQAATKFPRINSNLDEVILP